MLLKVKILKGYKVSKNKNNIIDIQINRIFFTILTKINLKFYKVFYLYIYL